MRSDAKIGKLDTWDDGHTLVEMEKSGGKTGWVEKGSNIWSGKCRWDRWRDLGGSWKYRTET